MPLNDPATNKYASKDATEGMNLPERQEYKEGYFGQEHHPDSPMQRFAYRIFRIWDRPVTWFRESVVEPLQQRPPYYHMVFRRVPTIDQCYTDDLPCQYEAHEQYKRDRLVETKMVHILRKRYEDCLFYYGHDEAQKCYPLREEYRENELNWFIKYGDLSFYRSCADAYYKQVHRMVWERRQAEKETQEGTVHE